MERERSTGSGLLGGSGMIAGRMESLAIDLTRLKRVRRVSSAGQTRVDVPMYLCTYLTFQGT